MKALYLFRHAESDWNLNKQHLIGGRSKHTPLSEKGEEQSYRLGLWIANRELKPDVVYFSPAVRTLETGRIALETAGILHEGIVDDRLQEMSQGQYEGTVRAEIYNQERKARAIAEGKDFKLETAESINDVAFRKGAWSEEARSRNGHHVIFAFTHGLAIRCYVGDLLGWSRDEILAHETDNASATEIDFADDGTLQTIRFNIDTQHAS